SFIGLLIGEAGCCWVRKFYLNLDIDSALTQSKFYRRKVTELISGSIGYSDAAPVLIMLPQTDTTTHTDSLTNGDSNSFNYHKKNEMTKNQSVNYGIAVSSIQKQETKCLS
ncbi:MAG TPA: hypothetical protein VGI82_01405, partial [Chitinophagaceae bacterium]